MTLLRTSVTLPRAPRIRRRTASLRLRGPRNFAALVKSRRQAPRKLGRAYSGAHVHGPRIRCLRRARAWKFAAFREDLAKALLDDCIRATELRCIRSVVGTRSRLSASQQGVAIRPRCRRAWSRPLSVFHASLSRGPGESEEPAQASRFVRAQRHRPTKTSSEIA